MTKITVIKRTGVRVPLQIEKIQKQVAMACAGIADVSQSLVEMRANIELFDGIETTTIDELLIRSAVNLITDPVGHVNYQYVAGRLRVSTLRKEVYGRYTPPSLYDIVVTNVAAGVYTKDLLEWYTKEEWDQIGSFIDHEKDEDYSYAAIEQLIDKYLVRNRVTGKMYETPQVRYAVAGATAFHAEAKNVRMRWVKDYYNCGSDGLFTLATPVLAGLGTPTKQFSSCVLIKSDDTLKSIFAAGEMMADYASKRAGIGLEVGRIRPLGAAIRGGEIKHTGLVPFLKKWFADLRSCSQGGIRNASATVTFPIWHAQFEDLIVLKNNQGTDETRVRHMDYSVALSGLFWKRLLSQGTITLFDPSQVPELYEAFYSDIDLFDKLYVEAERRTDITKKVLTADQVVRALFIKERTDTGRIYMMFVDNVQKQGPFDTTLDPIYQSNLCQEILLPTRAFQRVDDPNGRIALCTLGSINWGAFRNPEDMKRACRVLVRSLDNLLSYQDFLSVQSELSNLEFRPLGVGITNLAYWHAKRNFKYGDDEALGEVKRWMEQQVYFLTEASVDLAEERGACTRSQHTYYGHGVFPWERRAFGVNELTDFSPEIDWEPLRDRMLQHGVRCATNSAVAPVESSSVVINSTNGVEMPMALISIKESKGSLLIQVVPEYSKLKNRYQLMWEQTDCIQYLKTVAVIAAYTDQSISTNTFYNPKFFRSDDPKKDRKVPVNLVIGNLMKGYKWGLKTFYYSLIDKQGAKADAEVAPSMTPTPELELEDDCETCKL
jgi:ribonucleoside-diphosphate reductase alpha chain